MPTERFVLSDDEVTVLNHVIHALAERGDFEQLIPDAADRQALHNLLSLLEREDKVVLSAHYQERLEQARGRLLRREADCRIEADGAAPARSAFRCYEDEQ